MNAIVRLKNMSNFISFESFVIVGIDVKNLGSNHLIFFVSVRWLRIVMFIVGVAVYQ